MACTEGSGKTTANKNEDSKTEFSRSVIPKDSLLKFIESAASVIGDSSQASVGQIRAQLETLQKNYFVEINNYNSTSTSDTSTMYIYLDSAGVPNDCIFKITVLPKNLQETLAVVDFEKKFGKYTIETERVPGLIKEPRVPLVFKTRKRDTLKTALIKVYFDGELPKEDAKGSAINEIELCIQ